MEEYLNLLAYYLRELPEGEISDIIFDYEEHFREAKELGKSEDEIAKELGSPEIIARHFIEEDLNYGDVEAKEKFANQKKNKLGILAIIGIIILLSPLLALLVAVMAGFFLLIVGIIGIGIGILFMGIAIIASLLPGIIIPNFIDLPLLYEILHPITSIFLAISLIFYAIFIFFSIHMLIKWLVRKTKNLVIYLKLKLQNRSGEDE